jgi:hypothetical protein
METTPSLNSIIFAIWETIRQTPVISDSITEDLISFHIQNARASLIKQDLSKGRSVDSYIVQDLGCVELEAVDSAECCTEETGCYIKRTKLKIPSTIELRDTQLITRVGPVNKLSKSWQRVDYSRVPYLGLNKYTKKDIYFFLKDNDGYLYLAGHKTTIDMIEVINVQIVAENPRLVQAFKTCSGDSCYSDDLSYPVKQWMIDPIKKIVLESLGVQIKAPQDTTSDSRNNPTIQQ